MLDFEFEMDELSNIGDNFVNLIYSMALSNVMGKPVGKKVSNYILSEALLKSGLREHGGRRLDKHDMADFVESMIIFAWAKGMITMEETVRILRENLEPSSDRIKLRESSVIAFAELLKCIGDLVWKK
ncbi:MAG: ribonuclease III family protein [Candidatus Hydrothermarchaeales archaeon]